jgi:DNA-binding beta-propeller fold protein YncE
MLPASQAAAGDQPPVFVLKWGSLGSAPGQFNRPFHLATDSQGLVYVADFENYRVQKFDSAGVFVLEWGSFGVGDGQFYGPVSIDVDSDGEVFVGDSRIQVFTTDGVYLRQWTLLEDYPGGLAIGSDGSVYVISQTTRRVLKFSNAGALQATWGSPGFGDGQFNSPVDIAVDSEDNVYVSDVDRIQKFTSDGVFLLKWDGLGVGPTGIAINADNLYMVDSKITRVKKFTTSGVYLTEFGSYGVDDGLFQSPLGIAVGPGSEIYVADMSLHRVQKFASPWVSVEPESWGRIKGRYQTMR